ncbi:ABC transporter permease [Owenweeksia hongkongensis]|uniref:Transport permease protein n=1 Tax=Owenweeksia hongkongensis (strain DSM 17368 / CIP 108786 / JCM 12287 / NRRL B-23963 / UST20020801) TaxID=926562 RepID=G8R0L7_OWEHD|nr:ABC transporter permease [Owenweeksia hongkongensis]AEV32721.1 ABC-type polysaccharide/polyol phosphate export systems, permease component [Owenweeksia hongkongensis DSM 17368]
MKVAYESTATSVGFFRFWQDRFKAVARNRQLIKQLLFLSLTEQYKKTLLGSIWLVINPILSILIWLIMNYSGIYQPGETTIPYVGYLLLSMSIWLFFVSFFKHLATGVTESGRMLMEAPFEMEAKLVEKVLLNIVNFAIPLTINMVVLIIMGVSFGWSSLWFLPTLIPLMLLGISIGVFFSLIEVVFNDIYLIVNQGMNVLMFLTPVVYTTKVNSEFLQTIIYYNPLTYLISIPRDLLIGAPIEDWSGYWVSSGFALLVFVFVMHFFFNSVYKIVERIFE